MNLPAPVVKSTTVATSKGSIQSIAVTFTEPMTTSSADNRNNYALEDAGSTHIFGGEGNTAVKIKGVTYNSANDSVKLTLAKPVRASDSLRLTLNAQPPNGLRGANGQFLNEAANGTPGANAVIFLGAPAKKPPPPKPPKKKVTKIEAVRFAATDTVTLTAKAAFALVNPVQPQVVTHPPRGCKTVSPGSSVAATTASQAATASPRPPGP